MKKGLKNIIMICMALVLIGTSMITYSYASDKSHSFPPIRSEQRMPEMNGSDSLENFGSDSQQTPDNSQQNQPAERPDGEQQSESQMPDIQSNTQLDDLKNKKNTVSTLCYIFVGVQLLIIILILSYLAFSKFNTLGFKQTYSRFMK